MELIFPSYLLTAGCSPSFLTFGISGASTGAGVSTGSGAGISFFSSLTGSSFFLTGSSIFFTGCGVVFLTSCLVSVLRWNNDLIFVLTKLTNLQPCF